MSLTAINLLLLALNVIIASALFGVALWLRAWEKHMELQTERMREMVEENAALVKKFSEQHHHRLWAGVL